MDSIVFISKIIFEIFRPLPLQHRTAADFAKNDHPIGVTKH